MTARDMVANLRKLKVDIWNWKPAAEQFFTVLDVLAAAVDDLHKRVEGLEKGKG